MKIERRLITEDPRNLIQEYGSDILESPSYQSMKTYNHHRNSNTYAHCITVALYALDFAKRHKIKVDVRALVRGCLLHDYYLYNHRTEERIAFHLLRHPGFAKRNAKRDFDVGPIEQNMIRSHMWPLTFFHFPLHRESWILMHSDNVVALRDRFPKKQK